jgi:hypothetical protein
MRDVHGALAWVAAALDRWHCPYQVVGGLAALAHGGRRPLNDIDLYAPLTGYPGLLEDLRPHTTWGPAHYRDDAWDLVFMKIDFAGVRIEIGDASSSPRYFDAGRARWVDQGVDAVDGALGEDQPANPPLVHRHHVRAEEAPGDGEEDDEDHDRPGEVHQNHSALNSATPR